MKTALEIKWWRVAAIFGGLTSFQILFSTAALLFSRGSFAITDDVATFRTMFEHLPPHVQDHELNRKRGNYKGKFDEENGGYIWVFEKSRLPLRSASTTLTPRSAASTIWPWKIRRYRGNRR